MRTNPDRGRALPMAAALALVLMIALRVVALDSDAYPRLTYSSALLTDEGFYIHNARNLVLFGTERTDEFNNALLMPTLHAVQVGVFRLFGVGAVQARLISVGASLLTLLLFFAALRRAFGTRVAWFGTLFLGLDHVNLLYNRMALMDTPAMLLLVAAFWAFTRDLTPVPSPGSRFAGERGEASDCVSLPSPSEPKRAAGRGVGGEVKGLVLCGLLLGVAYATRSLVVVLFAVPLVTLWRVGERRTHVAVIVGLAVSLGLYAVWWYLPNREEMMRVSRYYLSHQLLPQSLLDLRNNMGTALFDIRRGLFPYLLLHTPVQFLLAAVFALRWGRPDENVFSRYLRFWLLIPLGLFCVFSYAPSRYYVLFYPAMAGLAALGLDYLWRHREGEQEAEENQSEREGKRTKFAGKFVGALALWAVINSLWLGDWLTHLRYTQRDTDRWLAQNLPPGSVLLGDAAPGVCLNNAFKTVPVIIGLCNDVQPLEKFAPAPRYVVILNGRNYLKAWRDYYPNVITPANQIPLPSPRIAGFEVAVYRVPPAPVPVAE